LKKKRTFGAELSHLPGQGSDLSSCGKYSGTLHSEGVLVRQPEYISGLLQLGYYGKGVFSRSVPTHQCLPELTQLSRQSRRRNQTSSDAEIVSTSAAVGGSTHDSEWEMQLKRLEEEEVRRVELHSQWKAEEEEITKGMNPLTGKHKYSHLEQEMSFQEGGTEEDKPTELKESVEKSYREFMGRIKEVRTADLYPVKEHLQLSSEEATYLAMELDVLQVFSPDGSLLNTETLWTHFLSTNDRFIELYTAYRYYRSKGWVPKSGLKFGVDFLLYKEGPSFYHSTYAVVVTLIEQCVEPVNLESLRNPPTTGLTWREVIALNRVNEAAGKELIVCYVVKPPSLSPDQFKLSTCLASLQVCEVFVKRWVPEKERQ
jgi:tRNA-splicing endonuclease subunit Sen2